MSEENKFNAFIKSAGQEIKTSILTKWIGCFVALGAVVLTFMQIITYSLVNDQDFSPLAIVLSVLGLVFFILLSLYRKTSPLAPIALMAFDFGALLVFVNKIIDYFSTAFFAGFSAKAFFAMPAQYWLSTVLFVLSFIVASVAIYLPQNRELKTAIKEAEIQSGEEDNGEALSNEKD